MSTAVAHHALPPPPADAVGSSRTYASIAPSAVAAAVIPATTSSTATTTTTTSSSTLSPLAPAKLPLDRASPASSAEGAPARADAKRSPLSYVAPTIIVKKEPASPDMPATTRHRPQRLNLSNHNIVHSSGALTARPSGPASGQLHDMGLACLSPGFHTQDPTMREQLQRSLDVRERQRQIIEARQKHGKPGPSDAAASSAAAAAAAAAAADDARHSELATFGRAIKTPHTSRRKGPPPALSIAPPAHEHFAADRVIQSAPINQTFTGLHSNPTPSRHLTTNPPSHPAPSSHIHHVHAQQTHNRLPPISDVFPEPLAARNHYHNSSPGHASHPNAQPPMPSPGLPPPHLQHPLPTSRPREYKSAEETLQSLSGGREDLLPRLVHYGGHQPPTPPSPMPSQAPQSSSYPHPEPHHASGSTRRRGRDEYETDNGTPPLGRQQPRPGPFGAGRDSPETQLRKKEEFMGLCARAWDLFHS